MKKISRLLALVLLLVITLFSSVNAFALTPGDKVSYSVRKIYLSYDTGNWTAANGKQHRGYATAISLRNKSDGTPIYCMQIYNACDNSAATAVELKDTNIWKNEYSDTAKQIVKRVSIWGYPNYTYGYSNDNAQLATQVLIWEAETGARTNYNTGCSSWAKQIFAKRTTALACYNKILQACQTHSTAPTLSARSVTLNGSGEGNAKYLNVTMPSGVTWNQFERTDNNSAIKTYFSASNNKLKIWYTGKTSASGNIVFRKKNTDLNSAYALKGAGQQLFIGSLSDPVNFSLSVTADKYCRVTVCKRDAADHSKILDGAVFMLQQWSESSQSWQYLVTLITTTMSDGTVRYVYPNGGGNNLLVYTDDNKGKFKLIERSAPAGYENSPIYSIGYQQSDHTYEDEHINTATGEFTFDPNSVVNNFQFYFLADDPQEGGSCKIIKTSDDDKVSGIQFTVTGEGFYYEIYKIIREREVFCTVSDKAR